MKVDIVVVSGKSLDTEPSVCISIGTNRYLFNVPDQTQRSLLENGIPISSLKLVCMTSASCNACSGFMGIGYPMLHEFQDFLFPVFSSPDVCTLIKSQCQYKGRVDLVPKMIDSFADDLATVKIIQLSNTVSFLFETFPAKDRFSAKKAISLGVPPSALLKDLQNGSSVTLENGTIITPEMCVGEMIEGKKIMILDCSCIEDLLVLPDLKHIDVVIHFSKTELLENPTYISKFRSIKNNICFMMNGSISFNTAYAYYQKNRINLPWLDRLAIGESAKAQEIYLNCTHGDILTLSQTPSFKSIQQRQQQFSLYDPVLLEFKTFAITMLGTVAGISITNKATTSILVQTHYGNIIIDAGEGCFGQIRRKFGIEKANSILKNVFLIWTSHMHWDHVGGLHTLLYERSLLTKETVHVYTDEQVIQNLIYCEKIEGNFKAEYHVRSTETISIGHVKLFSYPVEHCLNSMGCVLDLDGFRIAFSGDHHIGDSFLDNVKKCDILIHEATKGNFTLNDPKWGHSSIPSAEKAGCVLGAKLNILTHLSKKYVNEMFSASMENSIFAFDFLTITPENIVELLKTCRHHLPLSNKKKK